MPPEPLPCDRKDFFKERKHERSESSSLGSTPRWRESSSSNHYGSSRDFTRWGGSNDFRRPPGHGKQGGWHLFADDSSHGYAPSWTVDKMLEDENSRPSISRGDGKYGRNSRENRGSFSQRDWKGHSWEMSNGSANPPGRMHDVSNDLRSVDDMLSYPTSHPPHSDLVNTCDQLHLKDQHDNNKMTSVNGLGTGQRGDKDNSLDWKPLKWTRSGSLSSRGSGFSHSSSSKSLGGADSNEGKAELQPKNATPVQSPSGDAAVCVTSAAPSEETTSRKKPRLNWGEGLAKYEKKKVDGPEISVNKDGPVICSSNAEPIHSHSSNLADKSPRVMGFSDCASPATPSSVACSSSPGIEDKTFGKAANVDNDVSNLCGSLSVGSQSHLEGFSFNLEKLDASSIANLGPSLSELLQCDDLSSVDSSFARSSAMNKLLVLKGDISKTLEVTESEIDLLENELKSLNSDSGSECPCPAISSSVPAAGNTKPCNQQGALSNSIPRPSPLQVVSSGNEMVEKSPLCDGTLEEVHTCVKDDDIESPGTPTSKFVEPVSLVKAVSSSDMVIHGECSGTLDAIQATCTGLQCIVPPPNEEETAAFTCADVEILTESKDTAPGAGVVSLWKDEEDNLCNLIFSSNKESASRASEVFNKLLPRDQCQFDFSGVINVSLWQSDALVKEKFAMRKRFLRFKERVATLKFKAFQQLWKEDMRLLSVRKYRAKSQKKCESSLRTTQSGYQKYRSSIRPRFLSAAGSLSLVPTTEMLNFTSKLLSETQVKVYRNALKMPALILDKKERMISRFISSNGLVEDPCAVERERTLINPWTLEEREIFMDKLATFGKDFRKIAAFLDHKTTADCVEFYYKNHKSDCFEKTKKSKHAKSSTNYLVASGKKWSRDMNTASLHILGAASVMAADADNAMRRRQMSSGRFFLGVSSDSKTSQGDDGILERASNFDILRNERETVAADVLAGICGSMSSEAMSSCITSSVDPGEGYRERRCQKLDSVVGWPSTSDVTQNVDEETCSDESCGEMDPADWTDEEKSVFIRAVSSHGRDFGMISRCVGTRSRDQCKVFFSKARKCLGLDLLHPRSGNLGTPMSDDANGGGSDTEDACALETGSVNLSDKLGSKVDEDVLLSVTNTKQDESDAVDRINLHADFNRSDNDMKGQLEQKASKGLETVALNSCPMDHRSELTSNGAHQSGSVQAQKISIESLNTEAEKVEATEKDISVAESMSVGDAVEPSASNPTVAVEPNPPTPNAMVEVKVDEEVSANAIENDMDRGLPLPENSQSTLLPDSKTTSNPSQLPVNTLSASIKLESVEKPPVIPLLQENNLAAGNSILQDSAAIQCEKGPNQDMLSTFDAQERREKQGQKPVSGDECFRHLSGHPLLDRNESSQVLRGYPLQIPAKREMNGDVSCRSLPEVQSRLNAETIITSQFVARDCYLRKCNSSKVQCPVPELPLLPQQSQQTSDHPRDHSGSFSDTEKPCRNGDVKLFGKILSNPSSLQKPNSSAHENDEMGNHYPKLSNKSSTLKFTSHHSMDGNEALLKFDCNDDAGLENVTMRSYGFWDRNRIQSGFSSVPDSSILLATYPAAFSNYPGSSSKLEQQTLQPVVKSNERNLNGISVFPPRELTGSNGVVDYQMYRSHDGNKVQPFSVDMKHRQDIFSEMQGRNGFEAISSLQQQGRGMVGMNVVGRGGVLVRGPCPVSDPVAAIKMHYAKNDPYVGQNGTIIREEESWRGKGDLGR